MIEVIEFSRRVRAILNVEERTRCQIDDRILQASERGVRQRVQIGFDGARGAGDQRRNFATCDRGESASSGWRPDLVRASLDVRAFAVSGDGVDDAAGAAISVRRPVRSQCRLRVSALRQWSRLQRRSHPRALRKDGRERLRPDARSRSVWLRLAVFGPKKYSAAPSPSTTTTTIIIVRPTAAIYACPP